MSTGQFARYSDEQLDSMYRCYLELKQHHRAQGHYRLASWCSKIAVEIYTELAARHRSNVRATEAQLSLVPDTRDR